MKARLATVIGRKVEVMLRSGKRIELSRSYLPELPPEYEYEKIKAEYGDILGVGTDLIYDTPSEELEPGCLYWADYLPEDMHWDNHHGSQLHAVLPNGNNWNIDSRASNCTLPQDRTHRCWCRHGEVPNITVNKDGVTCSAGGGSIFSGNYHGFLTNGEFIP